MLTHDRFKAARLYLGLSQIEMSMALHLNGDRAIRAYELKERTIPGPVQISVAYMLRHGLLPETRDAIVAHREKLAKKPKPVSRRRLRA